MTDPVAQLQAMFPDLDKDICESVLAETRGDLERAVNVLLEHNDPNYAQMMADQQIAADLQRIEHDQYRQGYSL
jgi:hypothetical protein